MIKERFDKSKILALLDSEVNRLDNITTEESNNDFRSAMEQDSQEALTFE
jgi:hypothetical protein